MSKRRSSSISTGLKIPKTFAHDLFSALRERGIPDENVRQLVESGNPHLIRNIAGTFSEAWRPTTLLSMIDAADLYGATDDGITETDFPVEAEQFTTVGTKVILYKKAMTIKDIDADLDARGRCTANISRLLAYGKENPDEQRRHPIYAVASARHGMHAHCDVPFLHEQRDKRVLLLSKLFIDDTYDAGCGILTIPNRQTTRRRR